MAFGAQTFDGFDDDTGRTIGPQEDATRDYTKKMEAQHPEDITLRVLCRSLENTARNIDSQNEKGKEISRNMSVYADLLEQISQMYPPQKEDNPAIKAFVEDLRK